jgi:hypothetical protein
MRRVSRRSAASSRAWTWSTPSTQNRASRQGAINSADDLVNPPELGLMEKLMPRVRNGRYVLIPTSEETRGHGTHSLPAVWGSHLEAFLKALAP